MRNNKNSEHIILYNRESRSFEEEIIFEKWFMDIFYGNRFGFILTELILKRSWFSNLYGYFQRRKQSKKKINRFVEQYQVDVHELEKPLSDFDHFDDFFIRKLKPEARPVNRNTHVLISPADARLSVYALNKNTVFPVKGKMFTLEELVGTAHLGSMKKFYEGLCLIFRLAPTDYHRFCYIDEGTQDPVKTVPGFFHSVSPLSLARYIPVFIQNHRDVSVLHTKNFSEVLHIDVGALVVGRIVQHHYDGYCFERGEEKGFFQFGGSTTILCFKKDVLQLDEDILAHSNKGVEVLVKYGARIGKQKKHKF